MRDRENTLALLPAALAGLALGCGGADEARDEGAALQVPAASEVGAVLESITADGLLAHIDVLASDEFEGRGPGTPGEELTVAYLTEQLRDLGLEPGNPDGTYIQEVPLVGLTPEITDASFVVGDEAVRMEGKTDFVGYTQRVVPEISIEDSEIVFVGYGVVAPEYGWDDFKDVDVAGKTLLMLVNDPAIPDPDDPA
ncbi:MAG: hypothetical protein V3T24_00790, partial [Longimicrobiales bacterium]